ncbi:MAG: hypothetical protein HY001_03775 [Candidatus Portnoybacteria bacterium]|nr:hypothetical protein [Candidatus Portnoybacteria bacterium]
MSDKFSMSCGQEHELEMAFERTGWDNAEVKVLTVGNNLKLVRDFVRGYAQLVPVDHVVDCDADPFIPQDWSLKGEGTEHLKGGAIKLERRGDDLYANGKKIKLFLSEGQKSSRYIGGHKLREELAHKPILNANILDHLLKPENQRLIPESWKGQYVFFWGTVYRGSFGYLCVHCLYWSGDRWHWDCYWLGLDFNSFNPAALPASQ